MPDYHAQLTFAHHLADVADGISMSFFRRNPSWRSKTDGTIVTEADEAVERALRVEIGRAYPRHAIVGEEEGGSHGAQSPWRWIIDPIDGTINYSRGVPVWATLVALEHEDEIVVGVASAPALGERYSASSGSGAHLNGEPIRVSQVSDLAEARIGYGGFKAFERAGYERFADLLRAAGSSRGFGDFWGHMLVATGGIDAMIEPELNLWDMGPLIVIVEEAGGRFTDFEGRRTIRGVSAVSSNGLLHDVVRGYFDRGRPQART